MAEDASNKPAKKRQLKKTETVRQRVERGGTTSQTGKAKKGLGFIARPFVLVGKVLARILKPFAFVLIPFKTKPARFVGRILASVLLFKFIREAWQELRQVQWPNARETTRLTIAVFVFSLVFGTIIAITDYGLDKLFRKVFID